MTDALDSLGVGELPAENPADEEAPEPAAGLRLSDEESAALLDAIREGAASGAPRSAALGSADEPMRRALRSADEALPRVATALRDILVRASAGQSETTHEPAGVVTYDTLVTTIDRASAVFRLHTGDARAPIGLVIFGGALTSALLERRLGAPSALAGTRVLSRAPSPLERRVLEPAVREIALLAAGPFVLDANALTLAEHRAEGDTLSRFAPCLRMHVGVALKSGTTSDVTIALFGAAFAARPLGTLDLGRARVLEAVEGVEVSAVAVLGSCPTTVRGLLALEAGSVLRLDGAPDRPIEVRVDGALVLRGMPVIKDGNMAIEVRT